ncbi:hypothetical protein Syun_008822 [Stephania yunnanensis]|uniref:riboflavin kinase n=1 Tax=Stephania yunnanensis TaxID=152371 RepID=A0AAP0KF15_9MAGN
MNVIAVPSLQALADRYDIADSVLHSLLEFQPEHWGLPAFEDWMGNALMIEPLYAKGQIHEGLLYADADDQNALPDQISGVFFGWAKLDRHRVSKVVVSIEWRHDSCTMKRIIKPCLIGKLNKDANGQRLELLLVGYIKELSRKENASKELYISEEEKFVASEALDLPIFSQHMNNNLLTDALVLEDGAVPCELSNSCHVNNVLA